MQASMYAHAMGGAGKKKLGLKKPPVGVGIRTDNFSTLSNNRGQSKEAPNRSANNGFVDRDAYNTSGVPAQRPNNNPQHSTLIPSQHHI